jgi:TPP-dependent indolepyruvate ferredoxin oxidoreductase alpha subunit
MARQGIRTPKFEIIKQSPDLEKLKNFGCPAIRKTEEGKYYIDENLCWGCSVCSQIVPDNIKIKNKK